VQDFKPWHKPRKQFIRDKQWLDQLIRLIKENKYRKIETINYFGLPGGDLLDINYLYNGFKKSSKSKNKTLGFHGFINSQPDFDKAQGEITKLLDMSDISNNSRIDFFNFEDLIKLNSDAWTRIANFGVYHFINLDFCNNVITDKTLPSLFYLMDYQMKRVIDIPWLLCITTRLNKRSSTIGIIEKFQIIVTDFLKNDQLSNKIEECFDDIYKLLKKGVKVDLIQDDKSLNEVLQICFVLWVIKESVSRGHHVSLKSSFKYSVDLHNRENDMHSFVFHFEKHDVIAHDVLGLTVVPEIKNEKIKFNPIACNAIDKLKSSLDVDSHLESDKKCLNIYAETTMELLGICGYDISNYKNFMSSEYGYNFSTS
jgi:hypothetical protein